MTPGTSDQADPQPRKGGWFGLRLIGLAIFLIATVRFVRIALLVQAHGPAPLAGPIYFLFHPIAGLLVIVLTGIYRRSRPGPPASELQRKQAELLFGTASLLLLISFFYEMVAGHVP